MKGRAATAALPVIAAAFEHGDDTVGRDRTCRSSMHSTCCPSRFRQPICCWRALHMLTAECAFVKSTIWPRYSGT